MKGKNWMHRGAHSYLARCLSPHVGKGSATEEEETETQQKRDEDI